MKKLIALLLATLMVAALFAGCGKAGVESAGSQSRSSVDTASKPSSSTDNAAASKPASTLKVWMPPFGTQDTLDKDFWEKTLKPFGEKNNANITLEIVPWGNYEEKYLTGITSGNGPDVGYMYMEMISDFIDMGALAPLGPYLTDADKNNYLYLDKGVIKGEQYCLPIVVGNPRILVCNMDILKKSGFTAPPKTWDEFIEMGKKIAKDSPDKYPFLQEWADPAIGGLNSIFYPYLWQTGGDIFTTDGSAVRFNDEYGVKAAKFLYDLKFKHKILPDAATSMKGTDVKAAVLAGKVAMAVQGSTIAAELDKAGINWDYSTSLTDAKGGTFVAADSLVLISASKNKQLAAEAMKYMTSGPVMTSFHKDVSMFPPVGKDETYGDNPKLKRMYDNDSAYFHTLQPVKGSFKVYDNLYKNLQLMMLGQLTPEKALEDSATYAKTILGQ